MTKLVQALALLANATSMSPSDRCKFDGLLSDLEGAPADVPVTADVTVDVQPSVTLSARRRNTAQSAEDGKFVSNEQAAASPATTVRTRRKPAAKKAKKAK